MAGLGSLTWHWMRLHTYYTLNNQCAQVKPAISTHTQGEVSCLAAWRAIGLCHYLQTVQYSGFRPHHPVFGRQLSFYPIIYDSQMYTSSSGSSINDQTVTTDQLQSPART